MTITCTVIDCKQFIDKGDCEKYKDIESVNKFTTELLKKNNTKLVWNIQEKK